VDVAALAASEAGCLATIEHTYEMVQGAFSAPTEKTRLQNRRLGQGELIRKENRWHERH
jgi:hypothetical protein